MYAPLATLLTATPEVMTEAVDAAAKAPSNLFVVLMGLCTVFLGLICIILIIELMAGLTRKLGSSEQSAKAPAAVPAPTAPVPAAPVTAAPIENRAEIVAAVCAAVAEELGTDVSALRVVSFKKV